MEKFSIASILEMLNKSPYEPRKNKIKKTKDIRLKIARSCKRLLLTSKKMTNGATVLNNRPAIGVKK